jgi:hypothetical protein
VTTDSGKTFGLRKLFRYTLKFAAAILLVLALFIVSYDVAVYWEARRLLTEVSKIEPGKTSVETVISLAMRRGGVANVKFSDGRPIIDPSVNYQYVSFDRCKSDSCIISIPAPSAYHLSPLWRIYEHPKLFSWLPVGRIYTMRIVRLIIPLTAIAPPTITVRDGSVQDVTVTMAGSMVDRSTCPEVVIHHYGTPSSGTPWNVRPRIKFHTGGDCGPRAPEIRVDIAPDATYERERFSYALDLRCQWPGTSCTECEMLPGICEDMKGGNWFFYAMPEEELAGLKSGINNLQLGTEKSYFMERNFGNPQDRDARSKFEVSARMPVIEYAADWDFRKVWSDEDDEYENHKLTYYLKRWRARFEEDPRDRPAVSLIFDKNQRLTRIESHVDGIRSRS